MSVGVRASYLVLLTYRQRMETRKSATSADICYLTVRAISAADEACTILVDLLLLLKDITAEHH